MPNGSKATFRTDLCARLPESNVTSEYGHYVEWGVMEMGIHAFVTLFSTQDRYGIATEFRFSFGPDLGIIAAGFGSIVASYHHERSQVDGWTMATRGESVLSDGRADPETQPNVPFPLGRDPNQVARNMAELRRRAQD